MREPFSEGTRGLDNSDEHRDMVSQIETLRIKKEQEEADARKARLQAMEELGGKAGVITNQAALEQRTAEILAAQQGAQEQQNPQPPQAA